MNWRLAVLLVVILVIAAVQVQRWSASRHVITPRPQVTVRIKEGSTLQDLAEQLVKDNLVSSTKQALDYWGMIPTRSSLPPALADLPTSTVEFLNQYKPAGLGLEGYLFPDTYKVWTNDVLRHLTIKAVNKMIAVMTTELAQSKLWPDNLNVHQVLILAAIIEKEVGDDQNRAMVADVFLKRLKIGMALQSDATVNYVTHKGTTRPSLADISVDNFYNTYRYKGLPPGPIGNPSLSAIKSALNPKTNDYYYFLTTSDGQVIYSRTNKEHEAAKKKYLR